MHLLHKIERGIEIERPATADSIPMAAPVPPPVAMASVPPPAVDDVATDDCWHIIPRTGVWWHDPGNIALDYEALTRKPTAEPKICQVCPCNLFWEDIGGLVHCAECEKIPSLRMVKDFWRAIPNDEPNAMRAWTASGWERWFPRPKTLEFLFSHLVEAQRKRDDAAAEASQF